jgi:hypothetical protein
MPEEAAKSNQNITAGDGSKNYQSVGDMTIHNHGPAVAAQSLIQRPTDEDIKKFDPHTARIIDTAERLMRCEVGLNLAAPSLLLTISSALFSIIFFTGVVWAIYKLGAWIFALISG